MDLNIGSVIKRLRSEHSVTQEELAEYLGISFQAVSKWENGATMPDITLLPRLAAFFGVRIDELFSVDHEDELERIDLMLRREEMTDRNYAYAKRVLDGILRENPKDTESVKRYAKVYLTKTNTDLLAAGRMLEKAMELSPLDEEIYFLYRTVRGGSEYKFHSDNDWFIRVCEPYAEKYP
ncbi:MAG: helix-turn-helix transcriptional regulator [Clostridia bacterium]|nr:helix-turn-helix transcriptional regulator [Clostridia bacterium]